MTGSHFIHCSINIFRYLPKFTQPIIGRTTNCCSNALHCKNHHFYNIMRNKNESRKRSHRNASHTCIHPARIFVVIFLYRLAYFSQSLTKSRSSVANSIPELCLSNAFDSISFDPSRHITTA